MFARIYPVPASWPGRLFLSSRPRGGDWLEEEVSAWRRQGIDTVVSLLTPDELQDLDLTNEPREAQRQNVRFLSCPIPDRGVPADPSALVQLLDQIHRDLQQGRTILVHCRQGVGRTGLVAASLLVRQGLDPEVAIHQVSLARGVPVPETAEQERFIHGVAIPVRS